jgi:hypothetical protein
VIRASIGWTAMVLAFVSTGCARESGQPQPQQSITIAAAPATAASSLARSAETANVVTDAAPPSMPDYLAWLASRGQAQVRDASGWPTPAPDADTALLRTYPASTNKGPLTGRAGERLTILTKTTTYAAGDEIRIVHVHEATREGVTLYVMGPKPIYGEYVDGVLASPAAAPPPTAYDGRTLESPGEDHNYEVSAHRLSRGRHELQWRFATLSGPTLLRSNVIVVDVR